MPLTKLPSHNSPESEQPGVRRVRGSRETSVRLGKSVSWLAKMRMTNHGPKFVKLGRAIGYRDEDIEEWLASRVRRSTSDDSVRSNHNRTENGGRL